MGMKTQIESDCRHGSWASSSDLLADIEVAESNRPEHKRAVTDRIKECGRTYFNKSVFAKRLSEMAQEGRVFHRKGTRDCWFIPDAPRPLLDSRGYASNRQLIGKRRIRRTRNYHERRSQLRKYALPPVWAACEDCVVCGIWLVDMIHAQIEHLMDVATHGEKIDANLGLSHPACNLAKMNHGLDKARSIIRGKVNAKAFDGDAAARAERIFRSVVIPDLPAEWFSDGDEGGDDDE